MLCLPCCLVSSQPSGAAGQKFEGPQDPHVENTSDAGPTSSTGFPPFMSFPLTSGSASFHPGFAHSQQPSQLQVNIFTPNLVSANLKPLVVHAVVWPCHPAVYVISTISAHILRPRLSSPALSSLLPNSFLSLTCIFLTVTFCLAPQGLRTPPTSSVQFPDPFAGWMFSDTPGPAMMPTPAGFAPSSATASSVPASEQADALGAADELLSMVVNALRSAVCLLDPDISLGGDGCLGEGGAGAASNLGDARLTSAPLSEAHFKAGRGGKVSSKGLAHAKLIRDIIPQQR